MSVVNFKYKAPILRSRLVIVIPGLDPESSIYGLIL